MSYHDGPRTPEECEAYRKYYRGGSFGVWLGILTFATLVAAYVFDR